MSTAPARVGVIGTTYREDAEIEDIIEQVVLDFGLALENITIVHQDLSPTDDAAASYARRHGLPTETQTPKLVFGRASALVYARKMLTTCDYAIVFTEGSSRYNNHLIIEAPTIVGRDRTHLVPPPED